MVPLVSRAAIVGAVARNRRSRSSPHCSNVIFDDFSILLYRTSWPNLTSLTPSSSVCQPQCLNVRLHYLNMCIREVLISVSYAICVLQCAVNKNMGHVIFIDCPHHQCIRICNASSHFIIKCFRYQCLAASALTNN